MLDTEISVECEVFRGTFESEYLVRVKELEHILWQGFADKELVFDLEGDVGQKKYVKARFYAYLISSDDQTALIEFPVESTSGRRAYVPMTSVRIEKN